MRRDDTVVGPDVPSPAVVLEGILVDCMHEPPPERERNVADLFEEIRGDSRRNVPS
jgi:hypothetical protein